ncbi:WG repeat-containing protein [uncultured Winogradskyella sp.]|uniref:WG repeat-containing protein n=1 Tax=uncultured Winogradskyella sp. TaxID=395353 RepID=UPI00260ACEEC|nr:WG repeat-containing protein [uncultured Winogradskyella sp.]
MKKLIVFLVFLTVIPMITTSQELDDIDFISPFNDGLSAIQKGGKWAFINENGDMVIDYRDDLVLTVFNDNSYPIFNSGRCIIVKIEEGISYFGYIDKSGKTIIEPQYLNATNFNNGLAIILELHKNILGRNDILDKKIVDYSYTESAINIDGEIIHYLSDKPTHITLSKDYMRKPPKIKTKFISEKLVATQNKDNSWSIKKV